MTCLVILTLSLVQFQGQPVALQVSPRPACPKVRVVLHAGVPRKRLNVCVRPRS